MKKTIKYCTLIDEKKWIFQNICPLTAGCCQMATSSHSIPKNFFVPKNTLFLSLWWGSYNDARKDFFATYLLVAGWKELTQQWCHDNFPGFIDKDHWPPNSAHLNLLDYCIWDDFVKVINRNKVTSKTKLIQELKRAVKKIRKKCCVWKL